MEQYLIKRKRNGQFSKKGRVIKKDDWKELQELNSFWIKKWNDQKSYYKLHLYIRNFIIVVLVTIIIYLLVK